MDPIPKIFESDAVTAKQTERRQKRLDQLGLSEVDLSTAHIALSATVLVVPTDEGLRTIILDPRIGTDLRLIRQLPTVEAPAKPVREPKKAKGPKPKKAVPTPRPYGGGW